MFTLLVGAVYAGSMTAVNRRPYNKVAREEAQQRTRDALLDAAVEEFYEDRWQKTSLEGLAEKAGVTKQTLLRHFGSKDGLLLKAIMRTGSQMFDQRWSTPRDDVKGAVANLLDHYEDWGERSMRIGAWQGGPAFLSILSQAAREVHYDWVEYAFAKWLEPLPEKERARVRATLIMLCDVHAWWLLSNDLGLPRPEVRTILVKAIEGILPAPKA
jgi:AcrR family transcriptional regulator